MDDFVTTFWTKRLDRDETFAWDLYGVRDVLALDRYVGLTGMPNAMESIKSQDAFILWLESLPTSTTQMEFDFAESVLPLSFSTVSNLASVNSSNVDWLTGMAVDAAIVGDLNNGEYIALATLDNLDGFHFLDELTAGGTVSLDPSTFNPFTDIWWKVSQVSESIVTLENQRDIPSENYRLLDELTAGGIIGLALSTNNPFSDTQWKVSEVNDLVVTLENQRAIASEDDHFLDELTAGGMVSLGSSTFNPFLDTKWRVFNLPDDFRPQNPIVEESRENVTSKSLRKVFEILERLHTVPEYFMAVMGFEAGESYSSSERNEKSESVGLIQFTENDVQHPCTRGLASR